MSVIVYVAFDRVARRIMGRRPKYSPPLKLPTRIRRASASEHVHFVFPRADVWTHVLLAAAFESIRL